MKLNQFLLKCLAIIPLLSSISANCLPLPWNGKETSQSWIYKSNPVALNINTKKDSKKTAWKLIGPKGGIIKLKSKSGNEYILEIPEKSLIQNTNVSLSELVEIQNIPFGNQPIGVQLEPSGLILMKPATLSINPTSSIPIENQIFFNFEGEGKDLGFAQPASNNKEIKLLVNHFSGYGVTKGFLADYSNYKEKLGGSVEKKFANTIAEKFGKIRVKQLIGSVDDSEDTFEDIDQALAEYFEKVVKPRLDLLLKKDMTCAEGRLGQETALSLIRIAGLLQVVGYTEEVEKYVKTNNVNNQCMKEEYELCRDQHVIHRILPLYLVNVQTRIAFGLEDQAQEEREENYVRSCLNFRLEFSSRAQANKSDPDYYGKVDGNVAFAYTPHYTKDGTVEDYTGVDELKMTDMQVRMKNPNCQAIGTPNNGIITINNLKMKISSYGQEKTQATILEDLSLSIFTGGTNEIIDYNCKNGVSKVSEPNIWYGIYQKLHSSEFNPIPNELGQIGMILKNWKLSPQGSSSLIAEKNWHLIDNESLLIEDGYARLYHQPLSLE